MGSGKMSMKIRVSEKHLHRLGVDDTSLKTVTLGNVGSCTCGWVGSKKNHECEGTWTNYSNKTGSAMTVFDKGERNERWIVILDDTCTLESLVLPKEKLLFTNSRRRLQAHRSYTQ